MTDKVAIVTGAGSGIGEQTTYTYAKLGYSLALVDIFEDRLARVETKCQEEYGLTKEKILTIACDLAEESSYDAVIDRTVETFGRIDILVNNAGIALFEGIEETSPEMLDRMYNILLKAPFFLTKKALPHLSKTKGNIVNVSSTAGDRPNLACGYSTIKAGVEHLTRCSAAEAARMGIRINCVRPAFVHSDICKAAGVSEPWKFQEERAKKLPMRRVGQASEIASSIQFLSSDAASFTTGVCLPADGGYCLATPWNSKE